MGCGQSSDNGAWPPAAGDEPATGEYKNWSETLEVGKVPLVKPRTVTQIAAICNWAAKNHRTVRPLAQGTNWSPTVYDNAKEEEKTVLVNLMEHFSNHVSVNKDAKTITCHPGVTLEKVVVELDKNGLALSGFPGYGQLTIGGMVATASHGWVAPNANPNPNMGTGSLSNMVVSFKAVVSNGTEYAEKEFKRGDGECELMLVNFGRCIMTEITLRAIPQFNLRAISSFDYKFDTMFGPEAGENSYQELVKRNGRVGAVIIPFTDTIWTRVLSYSPEKPEQSRALNNDELYPYTFGDAQPWMADLVAAILGQPRESLVEKLTEAVQAPFMDEQHATVLDDAAKSFSDAVYRCTDKLNKKQQGLTPDYLEMSASMLKKGTVESNTGDIWGPSHLPLMYVKNTFKVVSHGVVVLCAPDHVQKVVNAIATTFLAHLKDYADQGKYPYAAPLEFRSGGLDVADDCGVEGASSPALSPAYHGATAQAKGWTVAVNVDFVTLPGAEGFYEFMSTLMAKLRADANLSGDNARIVPEWCKYFACTADKPWADENAMKEFRSWFPEWESANSTMCKYDPSNIFTNPWLQKFFLGYEAPKQATKA